MCQFDENYYKSLNYSDYLSRQVRYNKIAQELDVLLRSLGLLNKNSSLLDYGCATGFLMHGFKALGYENVYGYDVSDWAISTAAVNGHTILSDFHGFDTDILFALDVFEHMKDGEIMDVLSSIKNKILIARIPCSVDGIDFELEVSRKDPTHINCKTKSEWTKFLHNYYNVILRINLFTIYDSSGVACLMGIKR
jgi:hypothetical protein